MSEKDVLKALKTSLCIKNKKIKKTKQQRNVAKKFFSQQGLLSMGYIRNTEIYQE